MFQCDFNGTNVKAVNNSSVAIHPTVVEFSALGQWGGNTEIDLILEDTQAGKPPPHQFSISFLMRNHGVNEGKIVFPQAGLPPLTVATTTTTSFTPTTNTDKTTTHTDRTTVEITDCKVDCTTTTFTMATATTLTTLTTLTTTTTQVQDSPYLQPNTLSGVERTPAILVNNNSNASFAGLGYMTDSVSRVSRGACARADNNSSIQLIGFGDIRWTTVTSYSATDNFQPSIAESNWNFQIKAAMNQTGLPRRDLYQRLLAIKDEAL